MKTYVIPTSGAALPCPGGVLPPEGDYVEMNRFWRRRLADKDVVTGKPPRAPAAEPDSADTAAKKK
ncbi:DUF2635 domain-containing protein [Ancylobacter pratisalsi]|uniref:DUF2635 domain-containing protein n=1 Tax=Ancylobacter pratisalsi TaxID=1745854 RepID=A0A6P1YN51_9HYPH|nr:DUF2635 domain-containing protein [Ancylobacter pratisalsi]QIB34749.1 DUF2635 domain-containing protein [Ancylobacter pratisalsi]